MGKRGREGGRGSEGMNAEKDLKDSEPLRNREISCEYEITPLPPPTHPLHPNPPGSLQYTIIHQSDPGSKGELTATMVTACKAYL